VALLVTFDSLLSEPLPALSAAIGAAWVAAALAGVTLGVRGSTAPLGSRAAALLVLWYGFRGFAGSVAVRGPRRWLLVIEYTAFVLLAGAALSWIATRS